MTDVQKAAYVLSQMSDELTRNLGVAETVLRELRLGISAEVPMVTGSVLAWGKDGADWKLSIRNPQSQTKTEIVKAGRTQRTAAAYALPALLDALLRALEIATLETDLAIQETVKFTARCVELRGDPIPVVSAPGDKPRSP